jgi:hypothetical protein
MSTWRHAILSGSYSCDCGLAKAAYRTTGMADHLPKTNHHERLLQFATCRSFLKFPEIRPRSLVEPALLDWRRPFL